MSSEPIALEKAEQYKVLGKFLQILVCVGFFVFGIIQCIRTENANGAVTAIEKAQQAAADEKFLTSMQGKCYETAAHAIGVGERIDERHIGHVSLIFQSGTRESYLRSKLHEISCPPVAAE